MSTDVFDALNELWTREALKDSKSDEILEDMNKEIGQVNSLISVHFGCSSTADVDRIKSRIALILDRSFLKETTCRSILSSFPTHDTEFNLCCTFIALHLKSNSTFSSKYATHIGNFVE